MGVTIAAVIVLLTLDFVLTRRPHEVSMREATVWSAFYIALPLVFGAYIWSRFGGERGLEFLTGYVVERSVSVDNLFVFMLLLGVFAVPKVSGGDTGGADTGTRTPSGPITSRVRAGSPRRSRP